MSPAKVTWDFFLIEFRKEYISCHKKEQNRSGDQQKKVIGQSSNKGPREPLSQTSDQIKRLSPGLYPE